MWEVHLFQLIRQIFTHKIITFGKIEISIFCSFLKFVLSFETRIKKSCRKLPSVNGDAHFFGTNSHGPRESHVFLPFFETCDLS